MKKHHFFALLKSQADWQVIMWFAYGLVIPGMTFGLDRNSSFSLSAPPFDMFWIIMGLMGFAAVYKSGFGVKETAGAAPLGCLEFYFAKPVSRAALFYSRSCLYLFICLMPVLANLAVSYADPVGKVALYHRFEGERATEFYLAHFDGAHLEDAGKGNDKFYVVLPKGRLYPAAYSLVLCCAAALVYQLASFLFWQKRWGQGLVYAGAMLSLLSPIFIRRWENSSGVITDYETRLVWMLQHSLLISVGLVALAVTTQLYSCRRFINTETVS